MNDGLDEWTVLYREKGSLPADPPQAFICRAEEGDHADEQCRNAYPDCDVVWSYLGDSEGAYREYYDSLERDQ